MLSVVVPSPDGDSQSAATVHAMCGEAVALSSALEMDCWISSVLGQLWAQRHAAPPVAGVRSSAVHPHVRHPHDHPPSPASFAGLRFRIVLARYPSMWRRHIKDGLAHGNAVYFRTF